MKRIIFVNLHGNEFYVKTSTKFLFKHSVAMKHRFFLDYLLATGDIQVCSLITESGFTLFHSQTKLLKPFLKFLALCEHYIIMRKNELSNVIPILNRRKINNEDIVIAYLSIYDTLYQISGIDGFKAVSALHFQGEAKNSRLLKNSNPDVIFNESNLYKYSLIFQRYYSWYNRDFLVIPFVAAPRFKRQKNFGDRENRCFSTGTINDKIHPEFIETYINPCDQPSRQQILDNAENLKDLVACYNMNHNEGTVPKQYLSSDNILVHYFKVWYNMTHQAKQKKYFSFNMVDKFNDFKMCLVGEEILGVPGIGFVEGMCCGCAYIGQKIGYYEDLGMKEGVHYIGYDGTLEDLKAKIKFYQQPEHQEELERIANAGYEFANEHFRGEAVAKNLLNKLIEAQREWKKSKSHSEKIRPES